MSKKREFSSKKGYSFMFEDGGNTIEAWFSNIDGHEKVFVDGELVASQKNDTKLSINTFRVDEVEYSIETEVISATKGPYICTLKKNGENYKRQQMIFLKSRREKLIFQKIKNENVGFIDFLMGLGAGVAIVMADMKWDFSYGTWIILAGCCFIMCFIKIEFDNHRRVIEEISIE